MPDHDDDEMYNTALLQAELISVYAQLDHMSALAHALYLSCCALVQACEALKDMSGVPSQHREYLCLALREAREALRMSEHHV